MTIVFKEQPGVNFVSSPPIPKKRISGSLRRFLSSPKQSFLRSSIERREIEDTLDSTSHSSVDSAESTKPLRSCLKKSSSTSAETKQDEIASSSSSLLPFRRSGKRRCRKVQFDKVSIVLPSASSDFRDPALWWHQQDLYNRRLIDYQSTKSNDSAQSYSLQCMNTRQACAIQNVEALESSEKALGVASKKAETKLKRVFVNELLAGFLDGFRGLESPGGTLGGGKIRIAAIRASIRQVVNAQNCYNSTEDLAEIVAQLTLTDRVWARALAVGDELMVLCDQEE